MWSLKRALKVILEVQSAKSNILDFENYEILNMGFCKMGKKKARHTDGIGSMSFIFVEELE